MDRREEPTTTTRTRFPPPNLRLGFKDIATSRNRLRLISELDVASQKKPLTWLVVRASSEMDVYVAWTDEERNEEEVEY